MSELITRDAVVALQQEHGREDSLQVLLGKLQKYVTALKDGLGDVPVSLDELKEMNRKNDQANRRLFFMTADTLRMIQHHGSLNGWQITGMPEITSFKNASSC